MASFVSEFPVGIITSMIFPFVLALPFPIISPFWSGFVSRRRRVRKCLSGCVECDICPVYSDLELTLAALGTSVSNAVSVASYLALVCQWSCSAHPGRQVWASPVHYTRTKDKLYTDVKARTVLGSWGDAIWFTSPIPTGQLLAAAWRCWWVRQTWLSHVRLLCSPLHWGWRKSTQLPHQLSEAMDWLWILLTRTAVEGFCRGPGSGQDFSRCWGLPEASFRQAESSLSALPVMTLDEKTFFFKQ